MEFEIPIFWLGLRDLSWINAGIDLPPTFFSRVHATLYPTVSVRWLVGWLVGWFVGWLVGWSPSSEKS